MTDHPQEPENGSTHNPEDSQTGPTELPPQPHTTFYPNDPMYFNDQPPVTDTHSTNTQKNPRRGGALIAALVAGALIGGAAGGGVVAVVLGTTQNVFRTHDGGNGSIVINDSDNVNTITAVAANASPSVVTVSVSGNQVAGSGSGVILSSDGYVVTNAHVVTLDGSTADPRIQVSTNDGQIYGATIVGADPIYDLAVLKINNVSGLTPIEFADSSKLNVGDVTIAIGAPLGLSGTVTNGIVSAINRSITVQSAEAPDQQDQTPNQGNGGQNSGPFGFWNFSFPGQPNDPRNNPQPQPQQPQQSPTVSLAVIQTDAAINPGNSGGALLNSKGKLIGINVAIASTGGASSGAASGNIGVGFAIPSNIAKRVADEIIASGKASHALLGATVTNAASAKDSTVAGAKIDQLTSGGPAEKAGLQSGDVITQFNGIAITDSTDLTAQVRALPGGSEAKVTYVRNGQTNTTSVVLGQLTQNK